MADLFIDVLLKNREKGRFELHEFVVMPNHFHLLFTPAPKEPLEKCVQYIKGGFSFRTKKELGFAGEVWTPGYNEHRVKDAEDYRAHVSYIHENPVKAGLAGDAAAYPCSSAGGRWHLDAAPEHLQG
jgi:putative transposase